MRIQPKAMAAAFGVLWGGCMLTVGLIHHASPSYGADFLQMMSSVYPGYHASQSWSSIFLGTLYGLADGVAGGFLLGWIYDFLLARFRSSAVHSA